MMHTSSSAEKAPPRQRPQDVRLLGVVDVQPVFPLHADLESDLRDHLQRLPAKEPQYPIRQCAEISVNSTPQLRRPGSAQGQHLFF